MIRELAFDFASALAHLPGGHRHRSMLLHLQEGLNANVFDVVRHPTSLFQSFWNTCWWHDCPEAERHFEERRDGRSEGIPSWSLGGPKLHRLLEGWRATIQRVAPDRKWLRALRPPAAGLGSASKAVVRGPLTNTTCIACSGDGSLVVWAGGGGTDRPQGACVWLPNVGRPDFVPLQSAPFDLATTAGAGAVAFVFGKTCVVRGVDEDGGLTGDTLQICAPDKDAFHRVCFSPDGDRLALGLQSGRVQVASAKDGTVRWLAEGHGAKFVRSLAWSGDFIASGGDDASVAVWNAELGTIHRRFPGLGAPVNSVDIRGDRVLAGTGVNEWHMHDADLKLDSWADYQAERALVYFWDLSCRRDAVVLRGHREQVNSVRFINYGSQVLSCSGGWLHGSEHSAFVWDVGTGSLVTNLGRQATAVVGACADVSGRNIFTVCWDGGVQSWDGSRIQKTRPIISHAQEIRIVEFSPDGRRAVTTSWDDPPRIWDIESGVPVATLAGHECLIRTVCFSPDGRLVLTGAGRKYPKEPTDYTARLWEVETGRCRGILGEHGFPVTFAKFSIDGRFIVTGESDVRSMSHRPHTIRVWDARTLRHIAKIGRGQPEFMISLVSGEDPEFLMAELEQMGILLPEPEKLHLGAASDRSTETTVCAFKSPIRRGDATDEGGVVLGWVPEIPSNAITPYAWHSATMTFAIACGSDLRLYRLEVG